MKTLVVSDIHLNHLFDEKKFLFLKELFSSVDHVILNGDFWDGYSTTFDRFIDSPWKKLFPLLKKKKTIYLYGNHDQKKFSDTRVSLFSVIQQDSYRLKLKNITYHIEHGHILCPTIDVRFPFFFSRQSMYYINVISQKIEHISTLLKSPHNSILRQRNTKTKKKLQTMQFPHWYICGHTHYAEIDEKNKFTNSGFVQFGKASYLIVDSSGLSLQTNRYQQHSIVNRY